MGEIPNFGGLDNMFTSEHPVELVNIEKKYSNSLSNTDSSKKIIVDRNQYIKDLKEKLWHKEYSTGDKALDWSIVCWGTDYNKYWPKVIALAELMKKGKKGDPIMVLHYMKKDRTEYPKDEMGYRYFLDYSRLDDPEKGLSFEIHQSNLSFPTNGHMSYHDDSGSISFSEEPIHMNESWVTSMNKQAQDDLDIIACEVLLGKTVEDMILNEFGQRVARNIKNTYEEGINSKE